MNPLEIHPDGIPEIIPGLFILVDLESGYWYCDPRTLCSEPCPMTWEIAVMFANGIRRKGRRCKIQRLNLEEV